MEAEDHEDVHARRDRGETAPGTHGRTVTTLRPVAEHYIFHPEKRGEPLAVQGFPRSTYGEFFLKLRGTTGHVRWPDIVLFAPIRFKEARIGHDTLSVNLNRAIWSPGRRLQGYYRITLAVSDWSVSTRRLCRDEWRAAVELQREKYRQRQRTSVYAFFLGEQEQDDPSSFIIRDHRLVCFLNLGETEEGNL